MTTIPTLAPPQSGERSEPAASERPRSLGTNYRDDEPFTAEMSRDQRFRLLRVQHAIAPEGSRLRTCLRHVVGRLDSGDPAADVLRYLDDDGTDQATVSRVWRCGARDCVICGPKVADGKAGLVNDAVTRWLAAGGTVLHFGITCGRERGEDPETQRAALMAALNDCFKGSHASRLNRDCGGKVLRATGFEATTGVAERRLDGGRVRVTVDHHGHLHGLLFVANGDSLRAFDAVRFHFLTRLARSFARSGRRFNALEGGLDVQVVTLRDDGTLGPIGEYLVKATGWGVGLELVGGALKGGAQGEGRFSAVELLIEFARTGEAKWKTAYRSYLRATRGSTPLRMPKRFGDVLELVEREGLAGLNEARTQTEAADLGDELAAADDLAQVEHEEDGTVRDRYDATDEELANAEVEGGEPVVSILVALWAWIHAHGALGPVMVAARTAPRGHVHEAVRAVLERAGAPPGLIAECLVDRENGGTPR